MEKEEKYAEYSREDLVKEYLETRLASFIEAVGVDGRRMPTDINKDPAYWKAKDKDLHDMHLEIARRYGLSRDECLWLANIVDTDNFYIMDYKFKKIVSTTLKLLEKAEKEHENKK